MIYSWVGTWDGKEDAWMDGGMGIGMGNGLWSISNLFWELNEWNLISPIFNYFKSLGRP